MSVEIDRFCLVFALTLSVGAVASQWRVWKSDKSVPSDAGAFKSFQVNYLAVYFLAMMADWMQGPYVYALYLEYGYTTKEIGILFVVGFGTSAILGPVIGVLADTWGRRRMCLMYSLLYGISCMTKHSPNFFVLLFGRFLAGSSTSILFSVYDAWMVHEHHQRQFNSSWLGQTFNRATFGNGLVAIAAGVIAAYVGERYGKVAPFDVAAIILAIAGAVVVCTWTENYGEKAHTDTSLGSNPVMKPSGNLLLSIIQGCRTIITSRNILLCGLLQSCFEGAMYTFVFQWTPALPSNVNHGLVFTCFMVAMIIGSAIPGMTALPGQRLLAINCLVSSACLAIPILIEDPHVRICGFVGFEACCGTYFASYYTLRSQIVPDSARATINNIYRIPLNMIVVAFCLGNSYFTDAGVFTLCSSLLFVAALVAFAIRHGSGDYNKVTPVEPEAIGTHLTTMA